MTGCVGPLCEAMLRGAWLHLNPDPAEINPIRAREKGAWFWFILRQVVPLYANSGARFIRNKRHANQMLRQGFMLDMSMRTSTTPALVMASYITLPVVFPSG